MGELRLRQIVQPRASTASLVRRKALDLQSGDGAQDFQWGVADALTAIESGRAGALLDVLGGRGRTARRRNLAKLDESLTQEFEAARSAQKTAHDALTKALLDGTSEQQADATKQLDAANEAMSDAAAKIELRGRKGFRQTRMKDLRSLQRALHVGQVLVLYSLYQDDWSFDHAFALVLRRAEAPRIVDLGKASDLEAACKLLTGGDKASALVMSKARYGTAFKMANQSDEAAASPKPDWKRAIKAVRAALIDPLGLPADVKQVLVSPEGVLCYLPFGALFRRPVTMTPSGTTHAVLLEDARKKQGKDILALGDPDYAGRSEEAQMVYHRGAPLRRLRATGNEVEAIGTKGYVFTREKASEQGLRDALPASKRWRAVHLACHGLLDTNRPMLSALALSRAGEDDGFLTALEVVQMDIPADLVVLSACDTSRGRIMKGEGIAGFTRAFMFAGTPRVICSLWPVDDAATSELMKKFYSLWNPEEGKGLDAAEALQQAQAFIRDHPNGRWESPYFWAAWVLWGLPE